MRQGVSVNGAGGCLTFIIILAITFCLGMWWATPARAHMAAATPQQPMGWNYGWECCSAKDCAQAPAKGVTEGPNGVTVRLEPGEHPMLLWPVEITIPYGDPALKYESKDGLYHVCHDRQFIKPDGSHHTGRVICVYLPPRGF